MSDPPHILVLDRLSAPSHAQDPRVVARFVKTFSEAIRELQKAGYDAVVLRIEDADQMALVVRIKGVAPEVPLLAMITNLDPKLDALARESGADEVLAAENDPDLAVASMGKLLQTSAELISRSRDVVARSRVLRSRKQELSARARALRTKTFDLAEVPIVHLSTVVVEDDADHAELLQWTFRKLALPAPNRILKDGEEAIAYLAGRGIYRDREAHPLPTLLLLDLHLPRKSGWEVLKWIRTRPALSKLVVFILSPSPLREDFDRAIALGADPYFIKPV